MGPCQSEANYPIRLIVPPIYFACNYFDNIIVFSQSEEEHFQHLQTLFHIYVRENLKLSKYTLVKTKLLGL